MTSRRYVVTTLIASALLCGAIAGVARAANFYGVFGDAHGLALRPVTDERWSKYLFSFNYIPANFDSLLVGPSTSITLETGRLPGFHMYNASIRGANVVEERLVAENALERGHFKVLLFCLAPILLRDHERKAGGMLPRDYWSALGSRQLVVDAAVQFVRHHGVPDPFRNDGSYDFAAIGAPRTPADVNLKGDLAMAAPAPFPFDEEAYAALIGLADDARGKGIPVAVFFAPIYGPRYRAYLPEYKEWEERVSKAFKPGEIVTRFNDGTHNDVVENGAYFMDGWHLTKDASAKALDVLARDLAKPR